MRVDKKPKKRSSPKTTEVSGGAGAAALDTSKNLIEVFGKDEKKVQSLYHAVKLVKSIHLRDLDDEKME